MTFALHCDIQKQLTAIKPIDQGPPKLCFTKQTNTNYVVVACLELSADENWMPSMGYNWKEYTFNFRWLLCIVLSVCWSNPCAINTWVRSFFFLLLSIALQFHLTLYGHASVWQWHQRTDNLPWTSNCAGQAANSRASFNPTSWQPVSSGLPGLSLF